MKIGCYCGATILDSTDCLPTKGHLIADEEWFSVYDAIDDEVVDPVSTGKMTAEEAHMKSRRILSSRSWLMWQCSTCGRLYIDDLNGKLQCYVPEHPETDRQVLRSHEGRK